MPTTSPASDSHASRGLALSLAVIGAAVGVAFGVFVGRLAFGPPLVMLGLGGMTLGFAAVAAWRVLGPLVDPASVERMTAPTEPSRVRDLQREKASVLKAIKEVEMDFHMRKISEADYEEMTQRYRRRAMRLIGELEAGDDLRALIEHELRNRLADGEKNGAPEAGDQAAAAPGPHRRCSACQAVNDADAEFCKKCGHKLAASGEPT